MRVRLLGPFEVTDDAGRVIEVGRRKERLLLAALSVRSGHTVPADALIEVVWADDPPPTAVKTLRTHVSRLRRALADAGASIEIEGVGDGYRLALSPNDFDVALVEQLVDEARDATAAGALDDAAALLSEAAAQWRGRSLSDLADEPFARLEVERLEELRHRIEEDRIDVELGRGRHTAVVADTKASTDAQPLRERRWAQRMLALYRCGRQVEALAACDELRRHLVGELGLDPGPEIRDLELAILEQRPDLAWHPPPPASTPVIDRRRDHAATPTFVGREAELGRLAAAWAGARAGERRAVLIGGEAGIGKTALAAQVAALANTEGAVVVRGRSPEEMGGPYHAFAELLGEVARLLPSWVLRRRTGPAIGMLARFVPDLTEVVPGVAIPHPGEPEAERALVLDAVTAVITLATQRMSVVAVLDDLHWAGSGTMAVFEHLVRATAGERLLVVATYRDTEPELSSGALGRALPRLRRLPGVETVTLGGLAPGDVAAYLRATSAASTDTDRLARQLYDRTGGNPLFVREVVAHLGAGGDTTSVPETVRGVITERLATLKDEAATAVTIGAVAGPVFRVSMASLVAGHDVLDGLEDAARVGLLVEMDPGWFGFPHALIRDAVLATVGRTRRVRLHRQIAEAVEALLDADRNLEALAHHYAEAAPIGGGAKAAEYALAAARAALHAGAPEHAAALLERALAVVDAHGPADERAPIAAGLVELAETTRSRG